MKSNRTEPKGKNGIVKSNVFETLINFPEDFPFLVHLGLPHSYRQTIGVRMIVPSLFECDLCNGDRRSVQRTCGEEISGRIMYRLQMYFLFLRIFFVSTLFKVKEISLKYDHYRL